MQLFDTLTELTLIDGQALTAAGTDLAMLFADIATGYPATVSVDSQAVMANGQAIVPSAAPILDADFDDVNLHNLLLLEKAAEWLPDIDLKDHGLVITAPLTLTSDQLQMLGLDNASVTIQASELSAAMTQWQTALQQHPQIVQWYWLSIDSRCHSEWLQQYGQQVFSVLDQPEGRIPGEAMVLSHWQRHSSAGCKVSFAAAQKNPEEDPGAGIRTALLTAADNDIQQHQPAWAEYLSNDDLSRATAAELYHTYTGLWPAFEPDHNRGPGEPFLSIYRTLGDIGMASLPLGLLLARQRLRTLMQPLTGVGILINDGHNRHYWRLTDNTSDTRKMTHV
ncbi:hypothetical protein [Gynuella sp.]|uniref:hypothetical protein n=1 Tax=Gynuella sp. TaxID=2969146 RepID=UPI003D0E1F52